MASTNERLLKSFSEAISAEVSLGKGQVGAWPAQGGGFKDFLFSSLFGEDSQFD